MTHEEIRAEATERPMRRVRPHVLTEWRRRAELAITDTRLPGWPFDGRGPAAWGGCVEGMLGGDTGEYCAAVHPELLLLLIAEVEHHRRTPRTVISFRLTGVATEMRRRFDALRAGNVG